MTFRWRSWEQLIRACPSWFVEFHPNEKQPQPQVRNRFYPLPVQSGSRQEIPSKGSQIVHAMPGVAMERRGLRACDMIFFCAFRTV